MTTAVEDDGANENGDERSSRFTFGGSNGPTRNMWRSRRERARLVARYQIRQRVSGVSDDVVDDHENDEMYNYDFHHQRHNNSSGEESDNSDFIITSILIGILTGNRSMFSTTFMDCNHALLSTTVETPRFKELKSNNEAFPNLYDYMMHLVEARSGRDRRETLRMHFDVIECFTLYEFSAWLGRASMISALLLGGIRPTIRGRYQRSNIESTTEDDKVKNQRRERLAKIGTAVMRRFFDHFPLRLSTYLVSRVIEARWNTYWVDPGVAEALDGNKNGKSQSSSCSVCNEGALTLDFRLSFLPCGHTCCEACTWNHVLDVVDSQGSMNDIFSCPVSNCVCDGTLVDLIDGNVRITECDRESRGTPHSRKETSLKRFHELPTDQNTLKMQRKRIKKKKPTEASQIARSWRDAVLPSLGSSQDVRAEKFSTYIDRACFHYVRACLEAGVDVDGKNEYGQTALQVAVWRKFEQIVELLLYHGADPHIRDNAGVSCFDICDLQNGTDIAGLLSNCLNKSESTTSKAIAKLRSHLTLNSGGLSSSCPCAPSSTLNDRPHSTVLIPLNSDHDGAGSFLIDCAISANIVNALLDLFHSLPVHPKQRTKKQDALCSERSYYCDTTGIVQCLLHQTLWKLGVMTKEEYEFVRCTSTPLNTRFFPHMRFLNYKDRGIVLAPHVDLCRNHPFHRSVGKEMDVNATNLDQDQQQRHDGVNDNFFLRSTHTFILYLTDCDEGGATRLLRDVKGEGREDVSATVEPRRGRLLLFPHDTPHEGLEVFDVPKILLRGEARLTNHEAAVLQSSCC